MTDSTPIKFEVYEASDYVGAVYAPTIWDAQMDFWNTFLKDDHSLPHFGRDFILCRTDDESSRVFIVRAEQ